jgi:microsomal dipeptidase-like Zn-dependent dipeptidase
MSKRSLDDTFKLLDRINPKRTAPVIASHSACRFPGGFEYNLSKHHIEALKERRGVIGLIACNHFMSPGGTKPRNFDESMEVIYRHLDRIHRITKSHEYAAFGSDLDGFIKPTLPGMETPAAFASVEERLTRKFGKANAELICHGNAMRVLEHWIGGPSTSAAGS